MAHTAPCHVGDVQQAVNSAQINERTVLGDVFDHAFDRRAFFEGVHQLGALFAHRCFNHSTARQHDVVALAIQLDDLEFHGLVLVRRQVFDGAGIDERARQKGADAVDQNSQATFDFATGLTRDKFTRFEGFFQAHP